VSTEPNPIIASDYTRKSFATDSRLKAVANNLIPMLLDKALPRLADGQDHELHLRVNQDAWWHPLYGGHGVFTHFKLFIDQEPFDNQPPKVEPAIEEHT
jgi:hypothetical protein